MQRIILTGPTASGKGSLAVELARKTNGEIISVDSMKVFRGMDVGTAKPSDEVRRAIPIHLIDIADPWEDFSVGRYVPLALEVLNRIEQCGGRAILAGGTAMYVNALCEGFFEGPEADWELRDRLNVAVTSEGLEALHKELAEGDPEAALKVHPNDQRRIVRALEVLRLTGRPLSEQWRESSLRLEPGTYKIFGIKWEREELYRRINGRVERMVERNLFDEARKLMAQKRPLSRCASQCIGYKEIFEGLPQGVPEDVIVERIQRHTRRFAKQQLVWFRRFPIEWIDPDDVGTMAKRVLDAAE